MSSWSNWSGGSWSNPSGLVLDVICRLIREKDDAVSQRDVAQRTQLAKSSVCEHMRRLRVAGLVDIAPDQWGISDRISVTNLGQSLVIELRQLLAEAARGIV